MRNGYTQTANLFDEPAPAIVGSTMYSWTRFFIISTAAGLVRSETSHRQASPKPAAISAQLLCPYFRRENQHANFRRFSPNIY